MEKSHSLHLMYTRLVVRSLQISVFPNEIGLAKRLEKQREQDLLLQDVGDVSTTTALNTHSSGNGRLMNNHITPMASNTTSPPESVEGGQSEMRVLNTHLYTKNTGRRKDSRFESRTFSSSSSIPSHGRGTMSPDSQASEGREAGDGVETYVRQRSNMGNSSDNFVKT